MDLAKKERQGTGKGKGTTTQATTTTQAADTATTIVVPAVSVEPQSVAKLDTAAQCKVLASAAHALNTADDLALTDEDAALIMAAVKDLRAVLAKHPSA